nr:type VI-B CRISPR-associated RNA-guided ribonuclease Cas13b [Bacteroidales bacterium]
MENLEKNKTLANSPEYFGAYLNLARLNIFNISNYLAVKLNKTLNNIEKKLPIIKDDEKIIDSFLIDSNNKTYKKHQSQIFASLLRYMPITKVFDFDRLPKKDIQFSDFNFGIDIKGLVDSLKLFFEELSEFRNDYTHYYSETKKTVRKRVISKNFKEELEIYLNQAIDYTKEKFKDIYTDEDYSLAEKIKIADENNLITQDGLVFFISIFLDRENAFYFINKITGLKGTQNKSFKAKREVLMTYCLNLPHDKFISENAEQAFSLELLNELNKCPRELYKVIVEEEKQKFIPLLDDEQRNNALINSVPGDIEDFENYLKNITKRVRNKNRFAYFAIKYIDVMKLFKEYRFQIDLGKIIIDEYTKPLNGVEEPRTVVGNAKAFGRLQEFSNENEVLNKINKNANKTSFKQFAPYYNINNNKIGIYKKTDTAKFIADKKLLKQIMPEAFLSINELSKIILLEYLEKGKTEQIINDFIIINNNKLFNLDFINQIKAELAALTIFKKRSQGRKQKSAYNKRYLDELLNRKNELNLILAKHNLDIKQIPSRIVDYWLNIEDVNKNIAISDRIKMINLDCKYRLKAIENFKIPKTGVIATFIAKDIVDTIIGIDKKQKITSFYYDKIQECIALFGDDEMKTLLINILKDELKLYENDGHPFLNKIDFANLDFTMDLYTKYVEEKEKWIRNTFYVTENNQKYKKRLTVVKLPDDKSKLPYKILQLDKDKNNFDTWFNNITKGTKAAGKPIDLPVNLFDSHLKELLAAQLDKKNINYNKEANYNELFKLWWKDCRDDQTQPFYNAKREYVFNDSVLHFFINTKPKFKDYYNSFVNEFFRQKQDYRNKARVNKPKLPEINFQQVERTVRNKIGSTEREIRILQEEDCMLLLMFEKLINSDSRLQLKNLNTLLDENILVKQPVNVRLSFNENGEYINDGKEIIKNIIEKRKRKDATVLRRYLNDRRMPEL